MDIRNRLARFFSQGIPSKYIFAHWYQDSYIRELLFTGLQ